MSQSADARYLTSGSLPDTSTNGVYKEKRKDSQSEIVMLFLSLVRVE